jgi:hypothetical protein
MSEPTGNRWRDPDKVYNEDGSVKPREEWDNPSTLANPGNIQMDTQAPSDVGKRKYGPAVTDEVPDEHGTDKAQASIAAAHVGTEKAKEMMEEELPEVTPVLGTTFREDPPPPPPTVQGPAFEEGYNELIGRIQTLGRKANSGDSDATAELNALAEQEYSREDGGRRSIKARLNSYGVGRPDG